MTDLLHHLVQVHQEDHAAALGAVDLVQVGLHQRRDRVGDQVGRELLLEAGLVGEGEFLGLGFQEEVEGVVHRHLDHQVHGDLELGGLLGEHQARLVVGERVLLPVDEMARRLDLQRIRNDVAAAVRRGPQANHLGPQRDQAVVFVVGDVVQGGVDGHSLLGLTRFNSICLQAAPGCPARFGRVLILARPEPVGRTFGMSV